VSKDPDKKEVEELIEILAAYYPAAKQAIQVLLSIQRWAKHLEYPINSLTDLDKQVQKRPVKIDDKPIDLTSIIGPIPSYYFPVASYENLIEKVNELYGIKAGQQAAPSSPVSAAGAAAMLAKRFPPPPPRPTSAASLPPSLFVGNRSQ
jgi:hypothetical protein